MATKTITTYEHSCDLCREVHDPAELVRVYDVPRGQDEMRNYRSAAGPQIDICRECQKRPISELITYCENRTSK